MRALFCFILILIGLFHPSATGPGDTTKPHEILVKFEQTGTGQDRCCNTGCVAKVIPGKREKVARIKKESQAIALYFDEDSSNLKHEEATKAYKFVSGIKPGAAITIIGYADGCGKMSYNQGLSMRRAQKVKQKVLSIYPSAKIEVRAAGEISNGHNPKSRKVYLTLTTNVTLYDPPPSIISDVYLVDSSGSMAGAKFERYRRAITYHRPHNSRVYIATTACVSSGKAYNSISPTGGTEIWYAYWHILDKMQSGKTLTIISDFDSTYPLTSREQMVIQNKARQKQITVRLISI